MLKQFLKYACFALLLLAGVALYLRGDEPLDAANFVGYWIVAPILFGVVMLLFGALWDFAAGKISRARRGEWPKP